MARVQFENMTKSWGELIGINNLTLDIPNKQFLVLLGSSGCGKSTVLRAIAGLEEITSGTVTIAGQVINDTPSKERDIAMVFQSYALYPHLTAYNNITFGLKQRGLPKDEIDKRTQTAAETLGITPLLNSKPKVISSTQQFRVALGRAMVRNPSVFLFDEPLANLEPILRTQAKTEIHKLHQRLGATFIYTTNDPAEALAMADRIAVLDDGVLQQVDSPQQLYDQPANRFVAGFIGSPAMNFFDGSITGILHEMYVDSGSVRLRLSQEWDKRLGKENIGREVIFGIRPEDIYHPQSKPDRIKKHKVEATIDKVETMGNETLIHLLTRGSETFVARIALTVQVQPNDTVQMLFDPSKIYIFDRDTGKTLAN